MQSENQIRIAITGPESTGKSLLAEQLATNFNSRWVPEYARDYLDTLKRPYNYDDILTIARNQLKLQEDIGRKAGRYLFCDTELIVTKIWCEFKYGKCHSWILDQLEKQDFDLYLLMNIDLPWKFDAQREHPDKRKELFDLYQQELEARKFNFDIVSGSGDERLEHALEIIRHRI